jgi:xylulokinase
LGAAAVAAVGAGLWPDFDRVDSLHEVEEVIDPIPDNARRYDRLLEVFRRAADYQSDLGDLLADFLAEK